MKKHLLIEPHYLPLIEYFVLLKKYDKVTLNVHDIYPKQTYRNRTMILGANNVISLSIPSRRGAKGQLTKDVKIAYDENWQKIHWRSIKSAYGNSPFFEYFADYFSTVYEQKTVFLVDILVDILSVSTKILGLNAEFALSDANIDSNDNIADKTSYIKPNISYKNRNIFNPHNYTQVFGNDFVPNLSIVDLIFCKGRESRQYLDESSVSADD